jgi:hypothetical protein
MKKGPSMSSGPVFKLGRRHFLAGLGGFALAIPFLPSLEKAARAGNPTQPPRFFYLGTDHGGCWDMNFFPKTSLTNHTTVAGVSGHTVSSGALSASTSGGTTSLSSVLSASSSTFTSSLVGKMNVLRGLDVPWYLAHNTGLLGNFARNDGNGGDGTAVQAIDNGGRPTIDQIMASSNSFYTPADKATTKAATLILGGGATQPHSWAFTTPGSVEGGVTPVTDSVSSLPLFQSIFGAAPVGQGKPRKPVVDLVLGNYNSVMQSNARLSAADKVRLSQHISMLNTLESTLNATLTCKAPMPPEDNASYGTYGSSPNAAKWGQLYMDVLAAAFACNATRIGVFGFGDTSGFSPGFAASGMSSWHQDVAHQWFLDQEQGWLVQSYQGLFEQVFLYLAAALDGLQDANGQTVLDNSLIVWGQECCMETHEQYGIQTVSFGSAAGALNTGLYCDYRQNGQTAAAISPGKDAGAQASTALNGYVTYPGLLWEQWLATQLLAMGVPASEWELWKDGAGNTEHGYGTPWLNASGSWEPPFPAHYLPGTASWPGGTPVVTSSPYFQNASHPLPFLMK